MSYSLSLFLPVCRQWSKTGKKSQAVNWDLVIKAKPSEGTDNLPAFSTKIMMGATRGSSAPLDAEVLDALSSPWEATVRVSATHKSVPWEQTLSGGDFHQTWSLIDLFLFSISVVVSGLSMGTKLKGRTPSSIKSMGEQAALAGSWRQCLVQSWLSAERLSRLNENRCELIEFSDTGDEIRAG